MATPNTDTMETSTRGGVFEGVLGPLRRVWRLLCCCCCRRASPPEKTPVEETGDQSSVRPW